MGVVYLARDERLHRMVAIKMIVTGPLASPDRVARFKAEAQAIAQLKHENIVQIHEIGDYQGYPYFVLEYLEDGSLEEWCRGKPQPCEWAARMIQALAQAMEYAHRQGIVHRDLKPANILLSTRHSSNPSMKDAGQGLSPAVEVHPKIADFGLAKLDPNKSVQSSQERNSITRTGETMGTPSYMAPEQAQGRKNQSGAAVDVYSLGAILYELLTGHPPFLGPTPMDTLLNVVSQDAVPVRRLRPTISRDLDTICQKCLEKEPHRRYASAGALAADLGRFLSGEPILARPAGPGERLVKWAKRRPAIATLAGIITLLTLVALISLSWAVVVMRDYAEAERHGKQLAVASEQTQSQLRTAAEQALETARRNLYFSRISQAQLLWDRSDMAKVRQLLQECPKELRHWEWRYLWALTQSSLRTVDSTMWVFSMDRSPDGQWLALNQGNPYGAGLSWRDHPGEITILDAQTGKWHHRITDPGLKNLQWLRFSSDGSLLLGADWHQQLHVWSLPDFKHHTMILSEPELHSLRFSADGRRVVTATINGEVKLWSAAEGKVVDWPADAPPPQGTVADFNEDGRFLATVSVDGLAQRWEVDHGQLVSSIKSTLPFPSRVNLCSSGRFAIIGTHNGKASCLDFEAGNILFTMDASTELQVAYSPYESHAGILSENQLFLVHLQSGDLKRLQPNNPHAINTFAFSPDNQHVATGGIDGSVRLFNLKNGQELRVYRGHERGITALAFTDDGRSLWSADQIGLLQQWDITRPQEYQTTHDGVSLHATFGDLAFADQGRQVRTVRSGEPDRVFTFDAGSGKRLQAMDVPLLDEPIYPRNDFALSSNGAWVAGVMAGSQAVGLWHAATGEEKRRWSDFPGQVLALALNHDGTRLATVHYQRGLPPMPNLAAITLWDTATGQTIRQTFIQMQCLSLAFAPDGERLALGMLHNFPLANQPDSERFGPVILWEADGRMSHLKSLNVPLDAQAVAFSPQGDRVACVGFRHGKPNILVWDLTTGQLRHALQGPRHLTGLAFSPDGQRLATTGYASVVTLWDMVSGLDVLTMELPGQRPRDHGFKSSVAFSPDGRRLVASNFSGQLAIWDGPADASDLIGELVQRRDAARQSAPDWHLRMMKTERPDRMQTFRFHQQQLKRLEPLSGRDRLVWAAWNLEMGNWEDARQLYVQVDADRQWPKRDDDKYQYALLLNYLEEDESFHRFRQRLLEQAAAGQPQCRSEWLFMLAAIRPATLTRAEREQVDRLLHDIRERPLGHPWFKQLLALAELQFGDASTALRLAQEYQKLEPSFSMSWLAMGTQVLAYQRLGQYAEAQGLLSEFSRQRAAMTPYAPVPSGIPRIVPIHSWLHMHILEREARKAQESQERQ